MPSKPKTGGGTTRSLRTLIGGNRKQNKEKGGENGSIVSSASDNKSMQSSNSSIIFDDASTSSASLLLPNTNNTRSSISHISEGTTSGSPTAQPEDGGPRGRGNIIQRLRERSRSRSRAKSMQSSSSSTGSKEILVAVTSCRSDGYYNQKAPGSTFKLPRKAPTNLKLFHELAVGVKDAYAAVGATPRNPTDEERSALDESTVQAKTILWDFVGNLDFVSVVCH
jgi:hypothetical protein